MAHVPAASVAYEQRLFNQGTEPQSTAPVVRPRAANAQSGADTKDNLGTSARPL